MVMLYLNHRDAQAFAVARREVIRVHIYCYGFRFYMEEFLKFGNRLLKKFVGFVIFQVADMLAHNGQLVFAHSKTIHQFGACCQKTICVKIGSDRRRRKSA